MTENCLSLSKIGIIIPTYNRSQLISQTLDSVLAQSNPQWECVVVDDFSNDDTKIIVEEYCKKDCRISYALNKRKKGAQGARNTGILECTSDWILLLDSDNRIEPEYVEQILEYLLKHNDVDIVTNFISIEKESIDSRKENIGWITEGNIINELLNGSTYVDNSSACIRKSKLFEIGLLDENCPSFQEWDTHIRLSQISTYGTVPKNLTIYKDHTGKRISSGVNTIWANGLYVLKKHRNIWLQETDVDTYAHYLVDIFDKSADKSLIYRAKLVFVLLSLCPKVVKQLIKRRFKYS